MDGKWFHFDDDVVKKVSAKDAIEANWGNSRSRKNAYVLVYVQTMEKIGVTMAVAPQRMSERIRNRIRNQVSDSSPERIVTMLEKCDFVDQPELKPTIRDCERNEFPSEIEITVRRFDELSEFPFACRVQETLLSTHRRIAELVHMDVVSLVLYDSDQKRIYTCDMDKPFVEYIGLRPGRMTRREMKKLVIYYEYDPDKDQSLVER